MRAAEAMSRNDHDQATERAARSGPGAGRRRSHRVDLRRGGIGRVARSGSSARPARDERPRRTAEARNRVLTVTVVDLTAEERDLVTRMRLGDTEAFERFAEAYIPPLFRFASARLDRDRDLVPDVVQSVVAKALDRLDGFRGDAPLLAWLCVCCRNEIAGLYRKRARRPPEVALEGGAAELAQAARSPESEEPEALLLTSERRTLVHVALDRLPAHYAQALEWKYLEGLSVIEIARRLELSPKATESVLTRARGAFRTAYSGLDAVAPANEAGSPPTLLGGAP